MKITNQAGCYVVYDVHILPCKHWDLQVCHVLSRRQGPMGQFANNAIHTNFVNLHLSSNFEPHFTNRINLSWWLIWIACICVMFWWLCNLLNSIRQGQTHLIKVNVQCWNYFNYCLKLNVGSLLANRKIYNPAFHVCFSASSVTWLSLWISLLSNRWQAKHPVYNWYPMILLCNRCYYTNW